MNLNAPDLPKLPSMTTLLLAAALAGASGLAAAAPLACLIEPSQVVDIGSPVVGVIASVEVERGDTVRRGMVVATLRRDVERANWARPPRVHWVRPSCARPVPPPTWRSASSRAPRICAGRTSSPRSLEQARSEAGWRSAASASVREQQRAAASDAPRPHAPSSRSAVAATLDGIVTERFLNPGERVDDKPILRIARLDPLRVELVLPLADMGRLRTGRHAHAQARLSRR